MGRLTERNQNGNAYYPFCFKEDGCDGRGFSKKCNGCNFAEKAIDKLAAYEDIIDEPEKLKLIDGWYSELCRENGQLKKELEEYKRLEEQGLILRLPAPLNDVESFSLDGIETWLKLPCPVGHTVCKIDGVMREMQNDLISRSALIEQLKNCTCTDKRDEYILKEFAALIAENQPTAYDVDAVVEQLQNLQKDKYVLSPIICYALDKAIEIVRKGGVE